MGAYAFDRDKALKADQGGYITDGGVFTGEITKAVSFVTPEGAKGVEFAVKDCEGRKADFIKIYTKNKDGSENFAMAQIHALMGIFGLSTIDAKPTDKDGVYSFPAFTCRPVAFRLQREDYYNKAGDLGWSMKLLNWLYFDTFHTFEEKQSGKPAKIKDIPVKDKRLGEKPANEMPDGTTFTAPVEDDLPF